MKIGVIGSVFVDCMGRPTKGYFDPKGRNVGDVSFVHGGVGRNIAEDIRLAGSDVLLLGSVDNGPLGEAVLKHINEVGISSDYIVSAESGMGIWLAITDLTGEVAASISLQPDYSLMENLLEEKGSEFIEGCNSVALDADITEKIFNKTCDLCRKKKKPLYVATSNMEVVMAVQDRFDDMAAFICNKIEIGRLFGKDVEGLSNKEILKLIEKDGSYFDFHTLIVTTGADGVVWHDFDTNESGSLLSIASDIKDTTGAGDSFFAGFVYARTTGASLEDSVRTGLKFAASTLSYVGPVNPDLASCLVIE